MISWENKIAELTVPELCELMTKIMEELQLRLMQQAGEERLTW